MMKRILPRLRPSRCKPSLSKTHPRLRLLRHPPPSLSRPRWVNAPFALRKQSLPAVCVGSTSATSNMDGVSRSQRQKLRIIACLAWKRTMPPLRRRYGKRSQHSRTRVLWLRRTIPRPASLPPRARARSRLSPNLRHPRVRLLSLQVIWRGGRASACCGSTTGAAVSSSANSSSCKPRRVLRDWRSEEHTSELQSQSNLVCRLLLEKKKKNPQPKQKDESTRTNVRHKV